MTKGVPLRVQGVPVAVARDLDSPAARRLARKGLGSYVSTVDATYTSFGPVYTCEDVLLGSTTGEEEEEPV